MSSDASTSSTGAGLAPPNDLDAERYVLAELLVRPESFDEVSFLRMECFYLEAHRRIFDAVLALNVEGVTADSVAVATWLNDRGQLQTAGGAPYLAQLMNGIPSVGNVEHHGKTVLSKWRLRRTIALCHKSVAEAYGDCGEVQEFVERLESEIGALAHSDQKVTLELIGQIMGRELPTLRQGEERKGQVVGTPTGYLDLDRLTGGLHGGDLIIIAGRPGMGKTAFVTNLATSISAPPRSELAEPSRAVAMFSLEMPRAQIASRIACQLGQVGFTKLRQNTLSAQDWSKFMSAVRDMQDYPFWVDDAPGISLLELRSRVRKLKRDLELGRTRVKSRGLGLVVVDYLQLMQGQRRQNDTREREISSLSAGLKNLAKELGVPIVALSQLNRSPEKSFKKDKRPSLSDLRESGAIEQDADMVLFLYREHYYDKSAPKLDCECIVAKQRNGPTGTIALRFQGEYLRFVAGDSGALGMDEDEYAQMYEGLDEGMDEA